MPVEIRVPPLGESLVDAVVGTWLKSEGDAVSRGETLVELETDKVNLDVAAIEDGVLSSIVRQEGEVVTVGELLAMLGEAAASNGAQPVAEVTSVAPEPVAVPAEIVEGAGRAAPAVRRLAEEHQVDLSGVAGTGPGGRLTRDDVMAAATAAKQPAVPAVATVVSPVPAAIVAPVTPTSIAPVSESDGRPVERIRMTRRRQTIAHRLVEAQQTAAMLTTFNEVDMTAVMELRTARKEAFKEMYGVGLGYMSFFTKASVAALKAFPYVNAEIQGDEIVLKQYYDIGIAVSTEDGLVVPVVRDADRKSFGQIEKEILELAVKAREGKLALSEILGGTFTITNGGIFGSLLSTPILNTPQVGILGMHAIQKRPMAIDDVVVIRPMMYVALSYDHRVVDGKDAVQFLVRIKDVLEDPTRLLLEG